MLSWQIGDVKITRVVEKELTSNYFPKRPFLREATPEALLKMDWLRPHFVSDEGGVRWAVHALLVDAPGMKLVVDTCFGNDKPRRFWGGKPLSTSFLQDFEAAGWRREDVTHVICTHLHSDHVGWNTMLKDGAWIPTFPNARYLVGAQEYEQISAAPSEDMQQVLEDSVKPIFDAGLVDLVTVTHQLSPEVRLFPTPGHTPGHVSVRIESNGETAIITGDMMHHPCQITHPDWSPEFDDDIEQSRRTRRNFVCDVADKPILVIGTHFAAPTAGHVVTEGESFRLRY